MYQPGVWNIPVVPRQGTYMTQDYKWIELSTPKEKKEKASSILVHLIKSSYYLNVDRSLRTHGQVVRAKVFFKI